MMNFTTHDSAFKRAQPYMPYVLAGAAALGCLAAAATPYMIRRKKLGYKKRHIREAKELRENLSERDIDKTLKDSFPASDPPGWY